MNKGRLYAQHNVVNLNAEDLVREVNRLENEFALVPSAEVDPAYDGGLQLAVKAAVALRDALKALEFLARKPK